MGELPDTIPDLFVGQEPAQMAAPKPPKVRCDLCQRWTTGTKGARCEERDDMTCRVWANWHATNRRKLLALLEEAARESRTGIDEGNTQG